MGHIRLGTLPNYPKWRKIVALLAGDASTAQIATATMEAATRGLEIARTDEGLRHTFWLLARIPLAAREEDFPSALQRVGVAVPRDLSILDIIGSFNDEMDRHLRNGGRTDVGEMAQLAASESLTAVLAERAESLFGVTTAEVKAAAYSLSTKKGFAALAHDFF